MGELTDSLLPTGRESAVLDSSDLFPLYVEDDETEELDTAPRGNFLSNCRPKPNVDSFLHICDFPIYMNVGELIVHVQQNDKFYRLTEEEVASLEVFNIMIFRQILKLMKPFMIIDKENLENSYFIVPTRIDSNGVHEIDWDVVRSHGTLPEVVEPTEEERNNLVISEELFGKTVVVPWYRSTQPDQNYIVTQITSLTPSSPFPSNDYTSYADYYDKKYKLEIVKVDQPLLEVKAISNKINCLRPRGNKVSHSTSKRKRHELQEDFEENLIGELCMRFQFPSVLWLKATCLPTILHRINHILLAEELRQKIVRDIGVGQLSLQIGLTSSKEIEECLAENSDISELSDDEEILLKVLNQ
ncbi:hypothetical protein C0J52_01792 [Blattella germanica]|nr:hypothetical protein C0J52_01792 [Blattella germanica]